MGTMQARTTRVQNAFGMLLGRDPRLRQPVTAPGRQASMGTMQARATGAQNAFGMPDLEGKDQSLVEGANQPHFIQCVREK
jgi:hypothetical protein